MKRNSVIASVGIVLCSVVLSGCATFQAADVVKTHSAVTPVPVERNKWVERHESFNARAQQGDVDLIFIGDSITHGWEHNGKEVWDKYYGDRKAMNLGISGDRTQHVIWRLQNGNIDGISPKAAVLMIGTNNSGGNGNPPEEIADGITAIVNLLREKLPETKVLILAIFPRGDTPCARRDRVAQASEMVRGLADGKMVHYMDIGKHFVHADGTITKDIMPDYLHLTPLGYKIWAIAIESKLRELLGEKP